MKRTVVMAMLVFCMGLTPTLLLGQAFQYPSQERVQELLNQIEYCKQELQNTQGQIKNMEVNPSEYSLADYKEAQNLVERIKTCIASGRAELDSIRKEYPGWFNSPNAVLPYDRHQEITPRTFQDRLKDLEQKINKVLNDFRNLPKPKG